MVRDAIIIEAPFLICKAEVKVLFLLLNIEAKQTCETRIFSFIMDNSLLSEVLEETMCLRTQDGEH